MIQANVSHPPISGNPSVVGLWLQRIFAIPLALLAVGFSLAAGGILKSVAQGEFRLLVASFFAGAIGCISGLLATSLIRGRGVPQWFFLGCLRGFWLAWVVGVAIAIFIDCLRLIQGQQIDLTDKFLLYGFSVYCIFTSTDIFWMKSTR
jgi:hypothetical protein